MAIRAIVVPADIQQPLRLEDIAPDDLNKYRELVGGNIEIVTLDNPRSCMYFNEEGKALGLPTNQRATLLLWVHNSAFRGRDVLVGDTFLVGPPTKSGYDTAAPDELVKLLFHTQRFRVLVQTAGDPKFYGNLLTYSHWMNAYTKALHTAERWMQVEEVKVIDADQEDPK